jgi:hypothetical protein
MDEALFAAMIEGFHSEHEACYGHRRAGEVPEGTA